MATLKLFVFIGALTLFFCTINAPPKGKSALTSAPLTPEKRKGVAKPETTKTAKAKVALSPASSKPAPEDFAALLAPKLSKLNQLATTISKIEFKNEIVQLFLNGMKEPIPFSYDISKNLKGAIAKQLSDFPIPPTASLADHLQAVKLLVTPFENHDIFLKFKKQTEMERVKNFKNIVSNVIEENFMRIQMLTAVDPQSLVANLLRLHGVLLNRKDWHSAVLIATERINGISNEEYKKFVVDLKSDLIKKLTGAQHFDQLKNACDHLIIPRAFFVHMMDNKKKLEGKNKYFEKDFVSDFSKWLIYNIARQMANVENDIKPNHQFSKIRRFS